MNRKIILSDQAFLAVLLAAAEVYRREAYGLLFGRTRRGKTFIRGAVPYQTADRRFSEVALYHRPNRIIQRLLAQFPGQEYLGEFHSHADFRGAEAVAGLTPEDLESMAPGEIAIVVAVNPRRRTIPWSANRDGTLSGTLADFRFRLAAYTLACLTPGDERQRRLKPGDERSESPGCRSSIRNPPAVAKAMAGRRSALRVAPVPLACPCAFRLLNARR